MSRNKCKLEKLKIHAYKDSKRGTADLIDTFEVMFNPETLKRTYEIEYENAQADGTSGMAQKYSRSSPQNLNLNLFIDGTDVSRLGIMQLEPGNTGDVTTQVKKFLGLTYIYNGDIHKPNSLTVEWGPFTFDCCLTSVEITYKLFDKEGNPLQAELDVFFVSDIENTERVAKEGSNSPDLTHARMVKSGDTLPLLAHEIYNDPMYYPELARVNNLDTLRKIEPGRILQFPPIEQ